MFGLSRDEAENGADRLVGRQDGRLEVDGEVLRGGEETVDRHLLRVVVLELELCGGDGHAGPVDEAGTEILGRVGKPETRREAPTLHEKLVCRPVTGTKETEIYHKCSATIVLLKLHESGERTTSTTTTPSAELSKRALICLVCLPYSEEDLRLSDESGDDGAKVETELLLGGSQERPRQV